MITDIIKGFIIGICASAPIGPIAILVVQKTLSKGRKNGFVTALGACLVDTIFSIIALYALSFAQNFMEAHRELILLGGGTIVALLGWAMTASNPFRKMKSIKDSSVSVKDMIQAVVMGLSNPGAILVIFGLFAFFGIGNSGGEEWKMAPMILSLCAGTIVYWFGVTTLLDHFRKRFKLRTILIISRITGIVVIIIGIVLLAEGIYMVIMHGLPYLQ